MREHVLHIGGELCALLLGAGVDGALLAESERGDNLRRAAAVEGHPDVGPGLIRIAFICRLVVRLDQEALSCVQVVCVLIGLERSLACEDEVDQVVGAHGRPVAVAGPRDRMAECRQEEIALLCRWHIDGLHVFHRIPPVLMMHLLYHVFLMSRQSVRPVFRDADEA